MNKSTVVIALCSLAVAPSAATGQSPRDRFLVGVDWLAEHMEDDGLVLLHVGDAEEYAEEHLPGAQLIALRDVSDGHAHDAPRTLELMPPERLQEALRRFGIDNDSRIVIYFGTDWVTAVTRLMLTLHYAGLGDNASILDGGMNAWKAAGLPVTADVPEVASGSVRVENTVEVVVDREFVKSHRELPGYALVDGRSAAFYDGVRESRHGKGHIPGAGSFPFTETVDEELRFRSPAELRALLEEAGVAPGDTVIAYCHIGQQATAVLFAARLLGYDVLLYDGSMEDWGESGEPLVDPSAGGDR